MSNPGRAVIGGVDVDALAAAVRSCHGVEDLDPGPLGSVATYLPGRQLAGIRIASDRVILQVKGTWGVPVRELATHIQGAAAPLIGDRVVDVIVADLSDPPPHDGLHTEPRPGPTLAHGRGTPSTSPTEDEHPPRRTPEAADAPPAARSSAPTPTAGVMPSTP